MTQSALATRPGIEMALRQSASGGRHRRNSHAATWTMPRDHTELHAATGRTTPRHRKTAHAAGRTGPRHRKTPQASSSRPTPRHRKKGRGNIQAVYPSFHIGQDNSIWFVTRRAALPGALAVGLLAVGGVITGAFSTPLPGTDRADGSGPGGMASAPIFSPPALTAMSTPSPTLPVMADRGVRTPMGASGPAWPIIEQAGTAGVTGNGDTRQSPQTGTTTIVLDRAPEPGVFAPTVTADPPGGHGGGGGPTESSMQPEQPAAGGGGALSDMFGPGGLLNGLAGGPGDSGNTSPDEDGSDQPSRVDRPGNRRTDGPRDAGGAGRGFGNPGKTRDSGANRGSDGQTGGGGQHQRGGGRH